MVGDDGTTVGAVVVSRDVTDELEVEAEMHVAVEAAEQASKAKSDFLSRMSHELRTPLNSVLGFSQLLEMDDLPDHHGEAVGHIMRAGRHLLNLIDEVLDIARIESGNLELLLEPVAIRQVLGDAIDLARPLAERREISVVADLELCPDTFHVLADRQRLLQVMLNLLSNAVKYNRTGGRVGVAVEAVSPSLVRITVTDTGNGIRAEDIDRVFEPFDRLGAESSGVEGTGVGLTLSKYLVERMGGDHRGALEVRRGHHVHRRPAHRGRTRRSRVRGPETTADELPSVTTLRVLHIEDNLANLELVEQVLTRSGVVELLAAMSGSLGIELARQHRPTSSSSTSTSPTCRGRTCSTRCRPIPAPRDIPVVVVTADATPSQIQRLRDIGVAAYLTKPIDIRELLRVVETMSVRARGAPVTPRITTPAPWRHGSRRPGSGARRGRRPPRVAGPTAAPCRRSPSGDRLAGRGSGARRARRPYGASELTTFLDLSAQIFCITDFTGALVWWNAAFERTLGYSRRGAAAASGSTTSSIPTTGRSAGRPRPCWPRTARRGSPRSGSAPGTANGGGSSGPRASTSTAERVYGAARDVTERRRDEIALSESEARLRAIMKYSPSVIFVKDLEGRYLLVNDEFARAVGHPRRRRRSGGPPWSAGPRTPTPSPTASVSSSRTACPFVSDELLDHGRRPPGLHGEPLPHPRRGRHALRHRRDRLGHHRAPRRGEGPGRPGPPARLGDRGQPGHDHPDGPGREDPSDQRGRERAVRPPPRGVHPQRRVRLRPPRRLRRRGVAVHPHGDRGRLPPAPALPGAPCRRPLGHRRLAAAQAVLDDEGHFAGAVVVSRDITDKLESEQRLQTSRESAEKASKAKSDFLSRMSHELRTPLNSILGFAQLLQMDDIPGQQADAVDHILRAGRHLLDLIDEVLDIARIESGYLELTLTPVAVAEIVSEALELTNPMAARAEVVIRSSVDPRDGHVVTADRQRLMQVLLNLLSNAVKYNKPGRPCRRQLRAGTVGAAPAGRGRHREGHPPRGLDRVFVPFDRLGLEQTGIEGTGVGLALSQHLCERMGGELSLESVAGVGSTFVVELPARGPPSSRPTGASGSPPPVDGPPATGPRLDGASPRGAAAPASPSGPSRPTRSR